MNAITLSNSISEIQTLSDQEIEDVSGAIIPLVLAVFYTTGFLAGVAGGWAFGTTIWK